MAYKLEWDIRAYKELKAIENKQAVQILNSLNQIVENPHHSGKMLKGNKDIYEEL